MTFGTTLVHYYVLHGDKKYIFKMDPYIQDQSSTLADLNVQPPKVILLSNNPRTAREDTYFSAMEARLH